MPPDMRGFTDLYCVHKARTPQLPRMDCIQPPNRGPLMQASTTRHLPQPTALARIGVARLNGRPIGILRAIARQAMICLVLPTIVIGAERRALNDLALGTVVINRR